MDAMVGEKNGTEDQLRESRNQKAEYIKVAGAAGTGKTEFLLKKITALLEAGVDAHSIAAVVVSKNAKLAFQARLSAASVDASRVSVMTIPELCCAVLDTPQARAYTDRVPRVLTDAEYKILLEDMLTLGQKPGRLKKMLNFFYYQWSQLEPEDEWLLPREEATVRGKLDEYLRVRAAVLREEIAPLAASYVAEQNAADAGTFDYLLVDDFQNLGKASQFVCEALARKMLVVAGNESQCVDGFDPFPYPEGFTQFEASHEEVSCVELCESQRASEAIASIGNALVKQTEALPCRLAKGANAGDKGAITQIKWTLPEDEFTGISYLIKQMCLQDDGLDPHDIYLVVPNKTWAQTFKKKLAAIGVQSSVALDSQVLVGDPRNVSRAAMLVAYTKLNLLANPQDVVAWRSWCGFDDHLCYSGAWSRLQEWATQEQVSVLQALQNLTTIAEEPFLEAGVLRERYQSGQKFIDELKGKTGYALVRALTDGDKALSAGELFETVDGDEAAAQLFESVYQKVLETAFDPASQKVCIGSYKQLQGLNPQVVVMSGLIDGFMPSRNCFDAALLEEDRVKELSEYRKIFYNAVTKANKRLILSTIQRADLETAERLKMEVRRVRMVKGQRMAMLSPSIFIEEAGDTIPGSVSGEQYLGELVS